MEFHYSLEMRVFTHEWRLASVSNNVLDFRKHFEHVAEKSKTIEAMGTVRVGVWLNSNLLTERLFNFRDIEITDEIMQYVISEIDTDTRNAL